MSGAMDIKDKIRSHSVRHEASLLRPGASESNPDTQQFNTKPPYSYHIIMHIHTAFPVVVPFYWLNLNKETLLYWFIQT